MGIAKIIKISKCLKLVLEQINEEGYENNKQDYIWEK